MSLHCFSCSRRLLIWVSREETLEVGIDDERTLELVFNVFELTLGVLRWHSDVRLAAVEAKTVSLVVGECRLLPKVPETPTTEMLRSMKLFYVSHKVVEVFDECVVLIPVEQIYAWGVSFKTDIDRESTSSCVVIEAEDVNRVGKISFNCRNI